MCGDKRTSGSNKVAIFFNSKRFVYPAPSSSEIDLYVNTSFFPLQAIPNAFIDDNS